ncbi:MAG: vWA domain-containing protein, partial [Myxococcota bacterium]
MEFEINFRYPPNATQIADAKKALNLMSQMVCDATDGQVQVSEIRFTGSATEEENAAFWYYPTEFRSGGSIFLDGSSLRRLGSHLGLSQSAQFRADVLAHEMGHHAFGLLEQYDEQRRGGACGIGRGFEVADLDERNHTLMQQSGSGQCIGGSDAGDYCRWDSECTSNNCQPVLMSEFSAASNHDSLRGNMSFPTPAATTNLEIFGVVYEGQPVQSFDDSSFANAEATSSGRWTAELLDASGALPGIDLELFATRTGIRKWQLTATIDDRFISGTAGEMTVLAQWDVEFATDTSIVSVSGPGTFAVTSLTTSQPDLMITTSLGTVGDTDWQTSLVAWNGVSDFLRARSDGIPECVDPNFENMWNSTTQRYETSDQTRGHGDSDWETLVRNYPFLTAPAGLPNANPPANCLVDPTYVEDIVGAEQVLLLLDRSGSMAWSSSDGEQEVCDNGLDDDGDGDTDESACAESRMNFVHGAARAFIDLQRDAGIEVGLLEFDERNSVVRSIQNLDPTNSEDFKTDISGLTPRGRTAIGDALDAAKAEFAGVASSGRSQTAFLLTDGYSNEGSDPLVRAQELRDMNVRVFTIPTGSASDVVGLERVASTTRGRTMEADPVDELPAVYAELAAHYSRAGVVLPRTRFTLLPKSGKYNPEEQGDEGRKEDVPLPEAVFKLPVEKGAEGLVAFLSGNNRDMSTWGLELELFGPDGSYYDSGSPELVVDPYYVFFRIPNPADGQW